jgi:hypothetical protein
MSCPDCVISTLGRRGVGILQPQSGLDYPLTAPSADIRYLIADMDLSYDDPGDYGAPQQTAPPLSIKYLYGIGTDDNTNAASFFGTVTHAADILIVDSADRVIFNSVTATNFSSAAWGTDYHLYSWSSENATCSLLVYTTWPANDDEMRQYAKRLAPTRAVIDSRATYRRPKHVRSLRVETSGEKLKGHVTFNNGFNTEITNDATTTVDYVVNTNVTLTATAGSGEGKYDTCGDESSTQDKAITKINSVSGLNGDFLVSATDCLWARKQTVAVEGVYGPAPVNESNGHIMLGGDCQECCKCDDYVDLAQKINQFQSQYVNIGARVKDIKDYHEQNIQNWVDERACGTQRPLRLLLVAQRCPYMDVVLMVCNPCTTCLFSNTLQVALTPSGVSSHAELVTGYTALFSSTVNGRPVAVDRTVSGASTIFTVQFPIIKSSDSAYIRFRVKFDVKGEYAVTGLLTGTLIDNTPILTGCDTDENQAARENAEATATQSLYCDVDGNTVYP